MDFKNWWSWKKCKSVLNEFAFINEKNEHNNSFVVNGQEDIKSVHCNVTFPLWIQLINISWALIYIYALEQHVLVKPGTWWLSTGAGAISIGNYVFLSCQFIHCDTAWLEAYVSFIYLKRTEVGMNTAGDDDAAAYWLFHCLYCYWCHRRWQEEWEWAASSCTWGRGANWTSYQYTASEVVHYARNERVLATCCKNGHQMGTNLWRQATASMCKRRVSCAHIECVRFVSRLCRCCLTATLTVWSQSAYQCTSMCTIPWSSIIRLASFLQHDPSIDLGRRDLSLQYIQVFLWKPFATFQGPWLPLLTFNFVPLDSQWYK